MAQNPDPQFPLQKQSKFPWPVVALVAAALILAAFIYYLPRTPKAGPAGSAAQVPAQPFGDQLQLKNVTIKPAPTGDQIYIAGTIANSGSKPVDGVLVIARFYDKNGAVVFQDTQPMEGLKTKGNSFEPVALTDEPLPPAGEKDFRIAFANIPATWNHQVPGLQIAHVNFKGEQQPQRAGNGEGENIQMPASDQGAQPQNQSAQPHNPAPPQR